MSFYIGMTISVALGVLIGGLALDYFRRRPGLRREILWWVGTIALLVFGLGVIVILGTLMYMNSTGAFF